jgi:hypothetical protein
LGSFWGDSAIKMITFEMGYRPTAFDRPVTDYFTNDIRCKLAIAGVVTLTVIFKRGPHNARILHFEGPDEDITRAKAALHTNRELKSTHYRTDREMAALGR